MQVDVDLAAMRSAWRAVLPHAADDATPFLRHEVIGDDVLVMATDRFTAGMARVAVDAHGTGELGVVDLDVVDVKKALAVFPGPKKDDPPGTLRLAWDGHEATITDVSGMIEGRSLLLPAAEVGTFPALSDRLRLLLASPRLGLDDVAFGHGATISPTHLQRFAAAGLAYGQPVGLTPRAAGSLGGSSVVVGPDFIGWVTHMAHEGVVPAGEDDDGAPDLPDRWARSWRRRLPRDNRLRVVDDVETGGSDG